MESKTPRQLHLNIAESLQQQIANGKYADTGQLPPEIELAESWNVSRGTMRQALQLLVDQGLLTRIPGSGTFINNPRSVVDVGERNKLVGMIFPTLSDPLVADIAKGVERVFRQNHYSLIISHSDDDLEIEREQIEQLMRQQVAGILLFPISQPGEDLIVEKILEAHFPLVLLDREVPGIPTHVVMADHYQGAYDATRYLLETGHRRVVCVRHPDQSSSVTERIRGYEQAMRDAGLLPFAPIPLLGGGSSAENTPPTYSPTELEWVNHMLELQDRPTGIFCINDYIALGVMRHCLARGLQIPQDLAIIGFDNNPFSQMAPVPLTTISQSAETIGARAAEILLAQINDNNIQPQITRLPTTLIIRASA
jgi:DNA-binding LacI/PurR family transcriptional regulator